MVEWISRHKTYFFGATLVLALITYLAGINGFFHLNEDSGHYLILSRSLVKGWGYTFTASPVDYPDNTFPFVYPILLVPLVFLNPQNYLAFQLLTVFLTLLLIALIFLTLRRFFKEDLSIFIIPLIALNPLVLHYSHQILTEIPYTLFSLATLYLLIRYREKDSSLNSYLFLSVITLVLSFYTRSVGIFLFLSSALFFMLKKELRKGIFFSLLFLIFIIPWTYRTATLGRTGYLREFLMVTHGQWDLLSRWGYNLMATIGKELPDFFLYPFLTSLYPRSPYFIYKAIIGGLLALLLLYGLFLKLRKEGIGLIDLYAIIYFILILFWTHHGARYLLPLLPFLTYYFIIGLNSILRYNEKRILVMISLLLFIYMIGDIKEIVREHAHPFTPEERSFISAVDWLKRSVPKQSLILSRRPRWLHVYTDGYRGLPILRTKDAAKEYNFITDNNIDYIIIDQNKYYLDDARDYLIPMVHDYKDTFELVYTTPEEPKTWIYKVKKQ